jgi:hypothetical protein
MIEIHFGTSHFRSLKFPGLPPPRTLLPGVHDLLMAFLPHISGCESLRLFGLRNFQTFLLHFIPECFHLKSTILQCVSSGINGQYVLRTSDLQEFLTQHNLLHLSPLECLVSRLHNMFPHGKILEVDTWPNQAGDMCHVLTNLSILQMFKSY